MLSGCIGMGITMTFWVLQNDFPQNLYQLSVNLLFGFLVGVAISLGIRMVFVISYKYFSKFFYKFWIIIFFSFFISFVIFLCAQYIIIYLFHNEIFDSIVNNSLGVGILSTIVALFCSFLKEYEDKLNLETENRKLAVIEERNRIARELHDSVSQNLFGMSLKLNTMKYLMATDPEKAVSTIDQLQEMIGEIQAEMRLMIYELQPAALLEKGFFEAIESLVELFKVRYGLDITYRLVGEADKLDSTIQLTIYRVIQEALNNIVKHSKASKSDLILQIIDSHIQLVINDNGLGFELSQADDVKHYGIQGMRERIAAIHGQLNIETSPGRGTTIRATI